jgi:hypothetical protein
VVEDWDELSDSQGVVVVELEVTDEGLIEGLVGLDDGVPQVLE